MTPAETRVLEYLKKEGPTNTFRLSRGTGIKRDKLLSIIKTLEEKGAVEFKSGRVRFLKFIEKEEKKIKERKKGSKIEKRKKIHVKKKPSPKKKRIEIKDVQKELQAENIRFLKRISELEEIVKRNIRKEKKQKALIKVLQSTINELEKKAGTSKKIVKKVTDKKTAELLKNLQFENKKLKEKITELVGMVEKERAKIGGLRKTIKGLQQKTIMPKKGKKRKKKLRAQKRKTSRKIWIKNLKSSLAELNKNIQQLNIPEKIKKGGK